MKDMKIKIKTRLTGAVLFASEAQSLRCVHIQGADFDGAIFSDAGKKTPVRNRGWSESGSGV